MSYKYVSPELQGYEKIKVPRKVHNKSFPLRKIKPTVEAEYYYNRDRGVLKVQYMTKWWAKVILIILFTIPATFIDGFLQVKRDIKSLIWERKYGHFTEDCLFIDHIDLPKELSDILKN